MKLQKSPSHSSATVVQVQWEDRIAIKLRPDKATSSHHPTQSPVPETPQWPHRGGRTHSPHSLPCSLTPLTAPTHCPDALPPLTAPLTRTRAPGTAAKKRSAGSGASRGSSTTCIGGGEGSVWGGGGQGSAVRARGTMPDPTGMSSSLPPPPSPVNAAAGARLSSPLHSLQRPNSPSSLLPPPLPPSLHLQGVQQLKQLALDRGAGLRPGLEVDKDQQRAAAAGEGLGICKGRVRWKM